MTSEQDSLDRTYEALSLRTDIEKSVQERIDKSVAQLREGGVYLSRERAKLFTDALERMILASHFPGEDKWKHMDRAMAGIIEILTGGPDV